LDQLAGSIWCLCGHSWPERPTSKPEKPCRYYGLDKPKILCLSKHRDRHEGFATCMHVLLVAHIRQQILTIRVLFTPTRVTAVNLRHHRRRCRPATRHRHQAAASPPKAWSTGCTSSQPPVAGDSRCLGVPLLHIQPLSRFWNRDKAGRMGFSIPRPLA